MKMKMKASVAAIALGLSATSAYAMTPLEQSSRGGYYPNGNASAQYDKAGNEVRSRDFSDTTALEQSGRGTPDFGTASAQPERFGTATQPGYRSDASEALSPSIEDQAAAVRDSADWSTVSSADAGSGYTRDSDLMAGSQQSLSGPQDDKLVVIVPKSWDGSLPELIAALEQTSDQTAVVVVDTVTWNHDAGTSSSRFE